MRKIQAVSLSDHPGAVEAQAQGSPPLVPWAIAVFLAIGGMGWGVFLLVAIGPIALFPIPLLAGYLVTAGYIIRAISIPSLRTRQVIWGASIVVQGYWFLLVGLPDFPRLGPNLFNLWWAFATVCSVVAIVTERDGLKTSQMPPSEGAAVR